MTTKRKPYIRDMPSNWWQKLGFYRFYMLREGTAIPAVWFSIELIYGLFALKSGEPGWLAFVAFLQNPVVLALNFLTLLAAVLHTATWFVLAPKATVVIYNNAKVGPLPFIVSLWIVTAVVTVAILTVALGLI
ncbi:fumarate reductase subunit FrdC [Sodalis sp. RH21]|uniref:fumarate reductase subunit FrdC n=1 Tax=unclassified Sodalis (in: enterobacteria) TaxID=2636512 RepID=UPI0039B46545